LLGAITGDIVGSVYEQAGMKRTDFPLFSPGCRFTDDTVLTVAVAEVLLEGGDYADAFVDYFWRYPDAGYGGGFFRWASERQRLPYNSWGNGSAMRVSPVAYAFDTVDEVLEEAARSAAVTHDHPEGIKGAQAIAAAMFLARQSESRDAIRAYITQTFGYDLSRTVDEIRPDYVFDVSCRGSVPPAIIAFLDSTDFEDGVRKAVSLGGDSDTLACMAGAIAEAFYGGVPNDILVRAMDHIPSDLRHTVESFVAEYY
jgi:ADP-ribosylglycohydrolase